MTKEGGGLEGGPAGRGDRPGADRGRAGGGGVGDRPGGNH